MESIESTPTLQYGCLGTQKQALSDDVILLNTYYTLSHQETRNNVISSLIDIEILTWGLCTLETRGNSQPMIKYKFIMTQKGDTSKRVSVLDINKMSF